MCVGVWVCVVGAREEHHRCYHCGEGSDTVFPKAVMLYTSKKQVRLAG